MPERRKQYNSDTAVVNEIGRLMGTTPPQAVEVEEAVLGSMMLDQDSVELAMEELVPTSFYAERNRIVFEAVRDLFNSHDPVDEITVANRLKSVGKFEEVGGATFLADLTSNIGSAAHIEKYVQILKQKAIQRDLISAAHLILKKSYDEEVGVDDLIDIAQSKVYEATQSNDKKSIQDIGSIISLAQDRLDKLQGQSGLSGIPSGFAKLDSITNGWQPSDLIILAARPSVGKTAFSLNIARNAAVDHNIPVAFFSLEMSSLQLANRLMISESGLPGDKIKGGVNLENDEWTLLEQSLRKLKKAPLYVDETPSLPIMEFRSKVKALVKQKHVRLVIVDYLQLMQGPADSKGGLREQEVAAISRLLKSTAKELNIAIIALSQLSRASVQRTNGNGKPMLSDLRESGSIEQDADMVIFIHRPDFIGLGEGADKEKTEIIIAKHRNGETCDIPMLYKGEKLKFVEPGDNIYGMDDGVESSMNSYPEPIEPDSAAW